MLRGLEEQADATLDAHRAAAGALGRRVAGMHASAHDASAALAIVIAASTLVSFVVWSVIAGFAIARGELRFIVPVAVLGFFSAGTLAIGFTVRRRRQRIIERWGPRFDALTEQLDAQRFTRPGDLAAWGARWWRGIVPSGWLLPGPGWNGLALVLGGFPLVVSAHIEAIPNPMLGGYRRSRHAGLLLAGTPPRDVAAWIIRGEGARLKQLFAERGYDLEIRTGGLVLEARGELLDHIRTEPGRLGQLAPLALALARLAHHLRFESPRAG